MWEMERRVQRLAHNEDVNCGPLSLVMIAGNPNLWIHPCRRAAAQSAAVVEASEALPANESSCL